MEYFTSLILLIISEILILGLALFLKKEKKSQLKTAFNFVLLFMSIWTIASILQIVFQKTDIDPFFFEKISVFGVSFLPVAFLAVGIIFSKTKIKIRWYHFLFLIIPIVSIILTITNEYHHLFFIQYSINMNNLITGKYFIIHNSYTYLLYGIGIFYFIKYSIKNSGFFSKQSLLIILGISIPLITNLLGGLSIIKMTMYMTPISFSFLVIIKYPTQKFPYLSCSKSPKLIVLELSTVSISKIAVSFSSNSNKSLLFL